MRSAYLSMAAILIGALPASAQFPCDGPVNVSAFDPACTACSQVEMAISVDPNDEAKQVIAVTRPGSFPNNIRAWWTVDGGLAWNESLIPSPVAGAHPQSDPSVTHDGNGNVYVAYNLDDDAVMGSRAIAVAKSTDGGATFNAVIVADFEGQVVDKPWVTADPNPAIPGAENVYVAWCRNEDSRLFFSKSSDGGANWSARALLSRSPFFPSFCVGPTDEVSAIWFAWGYGDRRIIYKNLGSAATDLGEACNPTEPPVGPCVEVRDIADGFPINILASPTRAVYSVPSIDVDRSPGPNRGRLWAAFGDYSGDPEDMDVFVAWSDDDGATWSTPVNLGESSSAQFLPWLSVDNIDGSVGLLYYSAEDDPSNTAVHAYYRRFGDGNPSNPDHWVKRRLSETPSSPAGDDYREYIGLKESDGVAHAAWTQRVEPNPPGRSRLFYAQSRGILTQRNSSASNEAGDQFGAALATADFDGDGYEDVAIGVPYEDDDATDDGYVAIHYGSNRGLLPARAERIGQALAGTGSENGDHFALALAAGNFNGDAYGDLAVGVPDEDDVATDEGMVIVLLGSSQGLNPVQAVFLSQVGAQKEGSDRFGAALAAGDFNGDGRDELAVGIPGEDDGATNDGNVMVFAGTPSGPSTTGIRFNQATCGCSDRANDDAFGEVLATGNFDSDSWDDLAVGIPSEDDVAVDDGNVLVFYGSATGLTTNVAERVSQVDAGRPSEIGDRFGASLAVGDFNSEGHDDLAIGVPNEFQNAVDDGAVIVFYGSNAGLLPASTELVLQSTGGAESSEVGDRFGTALAAGDFDGDGWSDLGVSIPTEDVDGVVDVGTVIAFYGSNSGLVPASLELLRPIDTGDAPETGDMLGTAMIAGDFNSDCRVDLVMGTSREDIFGATDAGAVYPMMGSAAGFLADPAARRFAQGCECFPIVTAVEGPGDDGQARIGLHQAVPNPFSATTMIQYEVPQQALIDLRVYNVAGRLVCTLVDQQQPAGRYRTTWDGRDAEGRAVPPGVYLYKVRIGEAESEGKMVLVR